MKSRTAVLSRCRMQILVAVLAAWLPFAPAVVHAAPVTYNFSATLSATQTPGDPLLAAALAALPANAVISGSFVYDAGAPATGTGTGGTTIYGDTVGVPPSFSALAGSLAGISFSDPRGYAVIGDNAPFGGDIDTVRYYADVQTSDGVHDFTAFHLGTSLVVNMHTYWFGNFFQDQSLPGAPPASSGYLYLDISSNPNNNPNFSGDSLLFENLTVTAAVPEPQTMALMLAGLLMVGAISRKRNAARG